MWAYKSLKLAYIIFKVVTTLSKETLRNGFVGQATLINNSCFLSVQRKQKATDS